MKFHVFRSDKGDCLLLESDKGTRILADGGMKRSYQAHVAPNLGNTPLDLIYLSHIDQDHIAGVLQFMNDLMEWRVYDHRSGQGARAKKPTAVRPPEVKAIWHNAFHDQLNKNTGAIDRMLAANVGAALRTAGNLLASARTPRFVHLAEEYRDLATSQVEAMKLVRRVAPDQLGIPVNDGQRLLMVRPRQAARKVGSDLHLHIIGPFEDDLKKLRDEWNAWLRAHQEQVSDLRRKAVDDESKLVNDLDRLRGRLRLNAEVFGTRLSYALRDALPDKELATKRLGDRKKVTTPNLASLMVLMEEKKGAGKRGLYLFTGDGHCADIIKGLEHGKHMNRQRGKAIHVDVLKVQHHLSEHNWTAEFGKQVTADHYVICGNGEHDNPDLDALKALLDSRVGPAALRSTNPETGDPFTLWFNTSSTARDGKTVKAHMKKVEALVKTYQRRHPAVKAKYMGAGADVMEFSV